MIKELICVNCPVGCRLSVTVEDNRVTDVTGNRCPRGKEYAETECIRPERILTTTVRIQGAIHRVLPVITEQAIPLDLIADAMQAIRSIRVNAPVSAGDVIVKNLLDTGVDLVASRSMAKTE
jgi:CxxC motif-containing protein